ncbi:hypothetical protein [Nafulsella turpanensis]|nr:hypothetical protein [Nafulsella turpanensis]
MSEGNNELIELLLHTCTPAWEVIHYSLLTTHYSLLTTNSQANIPEKVRI